MPIRERIFVGDDATVTFEYDFRWAKADFKPHPGLTTKLHDQADAARDQITKEVWAFITEGRDGLPAPPPQGHEKDPDYITGRVFVSITGQLEGSGGAEKIAAWAGKEAFSRVRDLIEPHIIEGDQPW